MVMERTQQGVRPPPSTWAKVLTSSPIGMPPRNPTPHNPPAGLQPIAFDPDTCIATILAARPVDYAIKRIEAHKHVPLWYFTREGLREAAHTVRQSDDNDMLAVTKLEEGQVSV